MPFVPITNTSMVHVRWQAGTNLCENTFAYKWTGTPPTAAELLSLATEIAGSVAAQMRNAMHNGIVFREVYARNIHTSQAEQATYTFPNNTTGNKTGGALALSEAANIVKRTGLTGRAARGSNRISGFVEGDCDGNSIGSSLMSLLANICAQIILARVSGRFAPAVASRLRGSSTTITQALLVDSNVDSQKTRLNNHGS